MSKINFKKVFMKNFLSIGNSGQEFNYEKGIHAVTGHVEPSLKRNGVGKSTCLADSITFALFGKPLRKVNKEDIVNTINNKDCVVKVEFSVDRNNYIVERGIKPTYLKVFENDEEVRFDSMKNTQKWLENKIQVNFTCFSNIIVLNINHSRPFLDMDAKSKREVLEDILSLNIYSRMAEEAKKRHLDAKTNSKVYETEFNLHRKSLEQALSSKTDIEAETKKFEQEKQEKIKKLKATLDNYKKEYEEINSIINDEDFTDKINEESEKLEKVVELISKTQNEIILLKKETENNEKIVKDTANLEKKKQKEILLLENDIEGYKRELEKIIEEISDEDFPAKINKEKENLDKVSEAISTTKKDIALTKKSIKDSEEALETLEHAPHCPTCKTPTDNPLVKKYIEETKKSFYDNKNKLTKLTKSLEENNKLLITLKETITSLQEQEKLKSVNIFNKEKLETSITNHNKLLEQNKLRLDEFKETINNSSSIIDENIIKVKELEEKLSKAEKAHTKLKNNINKLTQQERENEKNKTSLDKLQHSIDTLTENIEHESTRTLELNNIISEDKITELNQALESAEINFENSMKQFNYNKILRGILGEDGVRKYVMSKVLPFLNQKVNQYLQLLGSDYSIVFDSNLQEKIIARNREVRSYDSFSSGEKKRIDLSVLLSLMDVAKLQNSVDTNILILDEIIDSSMDSEGVESFLEFLSTGFREIYKDKSIYIITHRKEIGEGEYFNSMINLVKKNGFTRVENIIQLK